MLKTVDALCRNCLFPPSLKLLVQKKKLFCIVRLGQSNGCHSRTLNVLNLRCVDSIQVVNASTTWVAASSVTKVKLYSNYLSLDVAVSDLALPWTDYSKSQRPLNESGHVPRSSCPGSRCAMQLQVPFASVAGVAGPGQGSEFFDGGRD